MEFLGIGPLELFFILLIALIFLGPHDMVKAGRTIGQFLRKVVTSPTWHSVQQTSRELRTLPNRLMREAGMEEDLKSLKDIEKNVKEMARSTTTGSVQDALRETRENLDGIAAWTTPPVTPPEIPNSIAPPNQEAEVTAADESPPLEDPLNS
jgi:Sec-independent protein translocase protein TatA